MTVKWIGAILVIVSCGGYGFSMAASCRREETMLTRLLHILEFMESDLEYRLTPLPQLCREAAEQGTGTLKRVFEHLAQELDNQISPNASCCMDVALSKIRDIPLPVYTVLTDFGRCLGYFDLKGQLRELTAVKLQCRQKLEDLHAHRDQRIRSYQTLGICAGIALAILFI